MTEAIKKIVGLVPEGSYAVLLFGLAAALTLCFLWSGQVETAKSLANMTLGGIMLYVKGR